MAEDKAFIDTDVVGGAADGSTLANAYATLFDCEFGEAKDFDAAGDYGFWECYATLNTKADTTAATLNGSVTSVADNIRIAASSVDGATSIAWQNGRYRLSVTDPSVASLDIRDNHVTVTGLQIEVIYDSAPGSVVTTVALDADNDIRLISCRIRGDADASSNSRGFTNDDADLILKIFTCAFERFDAHAIISFGADIEIDNTIVYNAAGTGIWARGATDATIKNAAVFACGTDFNDDTSGVWTVDFCASDDNTGTNNVAESGGGAAWPDDFEGAAAGDFRRKATSNLTGAGTNNPSGGLYANGMDGVAFTPQWSVGATAKAAAAGNPWYFYANQ